MSGKVKILIAVLVLVLLAAVALETSAPRVVDWTQGYELKGKRPYDLSIFREQLQNLPADSAISYIQVTPYEYLEADIAARYQDNDPDYSEEYDNADYYGEDEAIEEYEDDAQEETAAPTSNDRRGLGPGGTNGVQDKKSTDYANPLFNDRNICYILISNKDFVDRLSQKALMHFVAQGNSVLLISGSIPNLISDTLGLNSRYINSNSQKMGKTWVYGSSDTLSYEAKFIIDGFEANVGSHARQAGAQRIGDTTNPNLLAIPYGKGHFYLHSMPILFTNYFMLQPQGSRYVASVLGATGARQYFFQLNEEFKEDIGNSPLRFILSHPALRWAWFLLLLTLLVFIIFTAKRRQRIVPIISPLQNTTIDFTKTIANLYFEMKDHPYVIRKSIIFFLEYLRNKYHVDTSERTPAFIRQLSERSMVPLDTVQKTFSLIASIEQNQFGSEHALTTLEKAIYHFKQQEKN